MIFKPVDKDDLTLLEPYFAAQKLHIGDFSAAFQFMWHDALKPDYAFSSGCLVIREFYAGKTYFHYPVSLTGDAAEEAGAIAEIERMCREENMRLHFTNVPESRMGGLVARYGKALVTNNRRWRDYLYYAEDFKTYAGKKFAGQRNHVRKFEKLYPWEFVPYTGSEADLAAVTAFFKEYEIVQRSKETYLAEEEMDEGYAVLPVLGKLGLFAGMLCSSGKVIGFSAGERCGDMVVVHIEKALRGYEGAYPFLAQQFARMFCGDGVLYLNRMDDAGDLGLRKSKLQYNPCEIVGKYNVAPRRAIDLVSSLPVIHTARLTLAPVGKEDVAEYARLASDIDRNRYWGYDWRSDRKRRPADGYFLKSAQEDFRKKQEMPLGIYADGKLVGETVLHRFGYRAEAEIGVRLLPEAEGNGYAREAVRAYSDYAFRKLNLERVEARCYKENERSRACLLGAGMREDGSDATYYFFVRTAAT